MSAAFEHLLAQVKAAHQAHPALNRFCAFPEDLRAGDYAPIQRPCAALMAREIWPQDENNAALRDAFLAVGPEAQWRAPYAGTSIGDDFMARFGCYCLIGAGGPWISETMSAYLIYMPPGLWYPWHHHPAEEIYMVIAGEAEFFRKGDAPETLRPGDVSEHASNQPHAMRTQQKPVLAYAVWRNHLGVKPVLTPPDMTG